MYEEQQNTDTQGKHMEVADSSSQCTEDAPVVAEETAHPDCCEDCKRTCKRNFWTSILNAIVKISTIVLAAFGIESLHPLTPPPIGG